jgi:transcriptional regulator with XRE-family HTH domain
MALPGTPGQRISDLCNGNHITQKELAEKIGVSASQLSRIVSGETRTVSSDILIGVAKEFKVSTDYILGLSTVSVRKSYDISELGLSEGAVRGLVTGAVDVHKESDNKIREFLVKELIIPKEAKKQLRKELEYVGINQASLFPEVDKVADYLR